jgi:all-trans-retinol dehydrogenase (NAD+)
VVIWDLSSNDLEGTVAAVKKEVGSHAEVHIGVVDVTNSEAVYAAIAAIEEEHGDVWCLVNNAGIVSGKLLLDTPDQQIRKTFEVGTAPSLSSTHHPSL